MNYWMGNVGTDECWMDGWMGRQMNGYLNKRTVDWVDAASKTDNFFLLQGSILNSRSLPYSWSTPLTCEDHGLPQWLRQ